MKKKKLYWGLVGGLLGLGLVVLSGWLFLNWKQDLRLSPEYQQADEYLDEAVTEADNLDEQIKRGLEELKARGLRIANCQFDLNQACLPKFRLIKNDDRLVLKAVKNQGFEQPSMYALLYGDKNSLMYYESADMEGADPTLGAEYMVSSAVEFNNNPLIGAIFLKMINNGEQGFIKNVGLAFNRRLRLYYDYFEAKDLNQLKQKAIYSGFNSTEKQLADGLGSTNYTSAEKAVMMLGLAYFDFHFVELFNWHWQSLAPLLALTGEYELKVSSTETAYSEAGEDRFDTQAQKAPALGVCADDLLVCQKQTEGQDFSCVKVYPAGTVCQRENSQLQKLYETD